MNLSKYSKRIDGTNIYLKILDKENATEEYCDWLNDPIANKYLETRQATVSDLKKYVTEKFEAGDCLFFGIFWKENNKHIGNIKLEPIDFTDKKATLGILIGDKNFWGKGIGTETVNLIADYAFNDLKLGEVNLGVISENKPAIRLYEKCGFKEYGVKAKSLNHEGVLYDSILMKKISGD